MSILAMDTKNLLERIGSDNTSKSALWCIARLREKLGEIEATARGLDAVWDDEAQRVFINRFATTSAAVKIYLSELKILTGEVKDAIGQVSAWDETLTKRMGV